MREIEPHQRWADDGKNGKGDQMDGSVAQGYAIMVIDATG